MRRKTSIKKRILVSILPIIALVFLIVGGSSIYLNYISSIDLLNQTMAEIAEVSAGKVSETIKGYKNAAIEMGYVRELSADISVQEKAAIMNQTASRYGFTQANLLNTEGVSLFDGISYADMEYFRQSIRGNPWISEPVMNQITGKLSLVVSAPVWLQGTENSKIAGVVCFITSETVLNDIVNEIKVSPDGLAYIIDQEGYTIADADAKLVINRENIEALSKTETSFTALAKIHEKMRKGEAGVGRYDSRGTKKIAAFSPIEGTGGWSMNVTAPINDFLKSTIQAMIITTVLSVVSFIILGIVSVKIANSIGKPVGRCSERLRLLARGNLTAEVPQVTTNDEVKDLADATKIIVESLSAVIKDEEYLLGEMANGNFQVESQAQHGYIGDFATLLDSINKIIKCMNVTLNQIDQSSDLVAMGAHQVAGSAQTLNQGAAEQAKAIEALAEAVNKMSVQIRETAKDSRFASEKVGVVGKQMEDSNIQMMNMVQAISEITTSSDEIKKIIKTIEDIAFQTNILALNAAVEAARAGVAGKGFAVVADEVRNLASKSAEASSNTSQLIENSIQAVNHGMKLADETAMTLLCAVADVEDAVSLVDQISDAANREAEAIDQIITGIDQISCVIRTNSATTEESAAASEELSGQATVLKELLEKFRLK